ncbi:hypothetical protein CEP52_009244 [Fusarium oligoseptatum]|uniref:Uncharacterized protein n=1 Tax=Fusarium oligoseptatum TaxID=2604345 RepID=A0A428TDT5_9HYPO|nr:hypothetical protein CEP52_009244 [Fusarium oligoseptatum]
MSAMDREHISEKPATSSSSGPQNSVLQNSTEEKAQTEAKLRPERTATFKDYTRVFTYATKWDFLAYAAGVIASIGAGVTLPLLNVVFGQFVGEFTSLTSSIKTTQRLALYMFFLFLARFYSQLY